MRPTSGKVNRRKFLLGSAFLSVSAKSIAAEAAKTTNKPAAKPFATAPAILNLNDLLEPLRAANKVPALTTAVVVDGKLKGVGAVGIRKGGEPVPVKGTDLWHVGSCTKAMTATLIAFNVEKRRMQWDMTILDAIPDLQKSMHPDYRNVTLSQLLTHRAGLRTEAEPKAWDEAQLRRGTSREQRYAFVKATLAKEPESTPGTKYKYSNQGYAVAGVMLETIVNDSWENLMRAELFRPLFMSASGFGVPGTLGDTDQPWGHKWNNGKLEPQQIDNPDAIGPGGTVHCSIWDFARFAMFHLNGARGEGRLLKPETFSKLHTPPSGQDYAMGWNRLDRKWAEGYTLSHEGSNRLNFAVIWIAPKIKFAAVAATNIGGDSGDQACDETVQALIKRFVTNSAPAPAPASSTPKPS